MRPCAAKKIAWDYYESRGRYGYHSDEYLEEDDPVQYDFCRDNSLPDGHSDSICPYTDTETAGEYERVGRLFV